MKKFVFMLLSAVLLVSISYAGGRRSEVAADSKNVRPLIVQDDKVKIAKEELPDAAIKVLDSDEFKGWKVSQAYKTKNGEYEVELKNGAQAKTVKFDKDGKLKA